MDLFDEAKLLLEVIIEINEVNHEVPKNFE